MGAMRRRSGLAHTIPLAVVAWAAACGSHSTWTNTSELPDTGRASDDVSVGDDVTNDSGGGPPPDAIVHGGDDHGGDDAPSETGGKTCANLPDGTQCGSAPDICHDPPVCTSGSCAAPPARPDGFICDPAPDACHTDGTCKAGSCQMSKLQPESYQWQPNDPTARCCGGMPVHTTTDDNCNVCGIKCNAMNGESCKEVVAGRWFCNGCMASAACWSKCCSTSFNPPSCAASDCAGNCSSQYCPMGSHCVSGGGTSSDFCSY